MADLLPAIEIETAPKPDASVIWLHGLGDTGDGWSQVVPGLGLRKSMRVRFIFPHAPKMAVAINNGYVMPAWYDIREANLSERADVPGVQRSQAQLAALMARENARGVDDARIVLAGFSQGGAVALYTGLRYPKRIAGIVALSTYLISASALASESSAANRDVPIFMAHGAYDDIIPLRRAEQSKDLLVKSGYPVEWKTYPMPHSVCPEEIGHISQFLLRIL
jgi:phospholipase/carboxylesterase